jgi:gas vesicle protein
MIETVIGAVIGAVVSLLIAELYHRRSSRDLNALVTKMEEKNATLGEMLANLEKWQEIHYEDIQIIRKHAVAGTKDDPAYPYK